MLITSWMKFLTSITHIITGLNVGGAERALFNLLTNGLEGPFRNRVISLMGPGHYGPLLVAAGIPVTCLNMSPGRPTPAAVRRLLAACAAAPTDILQGWMIHGNLAATLAQRWGNRHAALAWNVRISLEAGQETKRTTRILTKLGAFLSGRPDAIFYNAQRSQQQYEAIGYHAGLGHYLPNGFDTEKWRPDADTRRKIQQELGLPEDARVIGYVGRGHPEKDLPNLFAAFDKITATHPYATLVAVGRDIAPYAGDRGKVILLGERPDVPDLLRGFDLLCLSSRAEGFPNVIGEAMASGLPCVSTDVGDASAIIGDTGWIAPPRDAVALAACLDHALACSPQNLRERGQRARDRIERDYSITSVVDKYKALYASLAKGTP